MRRHSPAAHSASDAPVARMAPCAIAATRLPCRHAAWQTEQSTALGRIVVAMVLGVRERVQIGTYRAE